MSLEIFTDKNFLDALELASGTDDIFLFYFMNTDDIFRKMHTFVNTFKQNLFL